MKRVLVITTEPLPVPGGLTTGAGLRAWGLAEGLRSCGFDVTLATPLEGEQARAQVECSTDDRVVYFQRPDLGRTIEQVGPDVIVMQHWGLMYAVPEVKCPLVIDLAGPHLLERLYWGNRDEARDLEEKLTALRRADFVICGGEYQRHYFWPYLTFAGFDITRDEIPVIPFSVDPVAPLGVPGEDAEPTFVYGGAFLAWQNPERAIRWLLDEMEGVGRGRLLFYGGMHPQMDASGGRFVELTRLLKGHPRVELRGWKPFAELVAEYAAEGHVALDLMERNPERELAYTTRTMVYLQCGLPVIYNNYSEISRLISRAECGWCLDPEDEAEFRQVVRGVLAEPGSVLPLRERARAAALEQSWDRTIGPLATFCRDPQFRERKGGGLVLGRKPAGEADVVGKQDGHDNEITRTFSGNKGKYAGKLAYPPIWLLCRFLSWYIK